MSALGKERHTGDPGNAKETTMAAIRFLWLDSYEWMVTLTGSALMVLAMWLG
jgi:hypothetical protein